MKNRNGFSVDKMAAIATIFLAITMIACGDKFVALSQSTGDGAGTATGGQNDGGTTSTGGNSGTGGTTNTGGTTGSGGQNTGGTTAAGGEGGTGGIPDLPSVTFPTEQDGLYKAFLLDDQNQLIAAASTPDTQSCNSAAGVSGTVSSQYKYWVWDNDPVVTFQTMNVAVITAEWKCSLHSGPPSQCPNKGGLNSEWSSGGFAPINPPQTTCGQDCKEYEVDLSSQTCPNNTIFVIITLQP